LQIQSYKKTAPEREAVVKIFEEKDFYPKSASNNLKKQLYSFRIGLSSICP
jgi:hypothetical protein